MPPTPLPAPYDVTPLVAAPSVTVRVPGSKSITNRALLCAALARGTSTVRGALAADDTAAMLGAVAALGARVEVSDDGTTVAVTGADLTSTHEARVSARQSGTTSRLVLPAAALRPGVTVVDGSEQLRARPFGPQVAALRALGAEVEELGRPGFLPLRVRGPVRGGTATISGDVSSQFLSGLLLAGPGTADGLTLEVTTQLVSEPYVEITRRVMTAFGAVVDGLAVQPGGYSPTDFEVEPDASSASYFFAAAAVTGGRVTVEGIGTASVQGDARFVDVLEAMGATVERAPHRTTVTGPAGGLHGVDVDMRHISDTAQTLAAVAVRASSPTRVRGIGFVRGKETDRIRAVVTELRRAGIDATEHEDGFTVVPGAPRPMLFHTYEDHRMAMSLALLGLGRPGIRIADPGCVAKTYPGYFDDLELLRTGG